MKMKKYFSKIVGFAAMLVLFLALVAWPQTSATYFYVVTAVDANGVESVFSNEASATIPSGGGAHSVSLSWTASTSTVAGYNVYRSKVAGGPYTKINPAEVAGLAFTDSAVQPNPPSALKAVGN
jgi:hypothetical protein